MAWHARLSASQTKQWTTCPGGYVLKWLFPEKVTGSSVHAQLGTAAHALVEECLTKGRVPAEYEGRLIEIIDPGGDEGTSILRKGAKWPKQATRVIFEVDQDMVEATEKMVFYVHKRCDKLGLIPSGGSTVSDALAVKKLVEKGTVLLEQKVNPLPDRDDTGGTADVQIDAWPELIEVVDYKHGQGVFVPVEENPQLRSYACGGLKGSRDYEKVKYTICQPRHIDAPPDGIMSEEMTTDEIYAWQKDLDKAAKRVDEVSEFAEKQKLSTKDPETAAQILHKEGYISLGDYGKHCTFCDFKTVCPAQMNKAQELASIDFVDEPGEIEQTAGQNMLAMILPWVPMLDKWIKAVEADAERLALTGQKVEGYKLVRKRTNRSLISSCFVEIDGEEVEVPLTEENIKELLSEEFDLEPAKALQPAKLKTGPQLEKLVEKAERARFNKVLLHKPEGALTLVPESDKREEETIDMEKEFPDN